MKKEGSWAAAVYAPKLSTRAMLSANEAETVLASISVSLWNRFTEPAKFLGAATAARLRRPPRAYRGMVRIASGHSLLEPQL